MSYPARDRPYAHDAYDEGVVDAIIGRPYRNPYDLYAAPTFWRGYMLGYQRIYCFGFQLKRSDAEAALLERLGSTRKLKPSDEL